MRSIKKVKMGTVVGHKTDKTATVEVARLMYHATFKKYVKKARVFKVHDAKNECRIGDQVKIVEMRPISRTKSWKLQKILQREETANL